MKTRECKMCEQDLAEWAYFTPNDDVCKVCDAIDPRHRLRQASGRGGKGLKRSDKAKRAIKVLGGAEIDQNGDLRCS